MVGTQIGRYQVVSEVGRGSMGVVYRAVQTTLNRTVALKVLSQQFVGSPEFLARFRREAATLACLAHDAIVHIYDIDEVDQTPFIVMEYVDGPSLRTVLTAEGRLEPPHVRDIGVMLASALAVAHRRGIVHRDVKPDNILFTNAGRPKLTDFGIAYMRDEQARISQTGLALGTPYYMAPEQAQGNPVSASDVYSLGVVLYEMLSGQVPFTGKNSRDLIAKHAVQAPRPLAAAAPGTPEELCGIVHRALAKAPADRYPSADELHDALLRADLSVPAGHTLRIDLSRPNASAGALTCPECGTKLQHNFLTCPGCARAVRRFCTRCGSPYDPVAPACPSCHAPTPQRPLAASRRPDLGPLDQPAAEPGAAPARAHRPGRAASEPARVRRMGGFAVPHARDLESAAAALRGVEAALAAGLARLADSAGRAWVQSRASEVPVALWVAVGLLTAIGLFALNRGGESVLIGETSGAEAHTPTPPEGLPDTGKPRAGPSLAIPQTPEEPRPASPFEEGDNVSTLPPESSQPDPPWTKRTSGRVANKASPAKSAFDSAAARSQIEAIVRRHERAVTANDLEAMREDMAVERAKIWEPYLRAVPPTLRDVRSNLSGPVQVVILDTRHARASFRLQITGFNPGKGERVDLWVDTVRWELTYTNGRWLITGTST